MLQPAPCHEQTPLFTMMPSDLAPAGIDLKPKKCASRAVNRLKPLLIHDPNARTVKSIDLPLLLRAMSVKSEDGGGAESILAMANSSTPMMVLQVISTVSDNRLACRTFQRSGNPNLDPVLDILLATLIADSVMSTTTD